MVFHRKPYENQSKPYEIYMGPMKIISKP